MCSRYSNTVGPEEIRKHFGISVSQELGTRVLNVVPAREVLAIVAPDGNPEAQLLRWGLIPPWATTASSGYKMTNARVESVAQQPAFRELIVTSSRRALQVADGYFEWLRTSKRGEPRQLFHFQVDKGAPFAFASLWTQANIEGAWVESITLLTCDSAPNDLIRPISKRMPVILADRVSQQAWLDPELDGADALALCEPLAADRMSSRPVRFARTRASTTRNC